LPDCSGVQANFKCTLGSSPSICICLTGFELTGILCTPICGDGLIVGTEKCDAGALPGCLRDCSGA